jgi:hypothetical protein
LGFLKVTGTDYSTGNILGGGQWVSEASILPGVEHLGSGFVFRFREGGTYGRLRGNVGQALWFHDSKTSCRSRGDAGGAEDAQGEMEEAGHQRHSYNYMAVIRSSLFGCRSAGAW